MDYTFVTGGDASRYRPASLLHGEAFKTDPVIQFLLAHLPKKQRLEYIPTFIDTLIHASATNGAIFDEAWDKTSPDQTSGQGPLACSCVWLPPGKKVDSLKTYFSMETVRMALQVGITGLLKMLGEFQSKSDSAKKNGLVNPDGSKIKRYYYLFFTSTAAEHRGKGLCSELIQRFQVQAQKENTPIWLESTTERSHRLYQKLGFKDVRTWLLGEGIVDKDGHLAKEGEGVPIWAMLWLPESGIKEQRATSAANK